MSLRGVANPKPEPGRFRCLVCRRVVTGTPSGHCPQCGFVPPEAPRIAERAPRSRVLWLAVALVALFAFYVFRAS